MNGSGPTETNSLIHLLNTVDTNDDNELHYIKHSAYYGENEFSKMLSNKAGISILSGNIQSIDAKYDKFSSFVDKVNNNNNNIYLKSNIQKSLIDYKIDRILL